MKRTEYTRQRHRFIAWWRMLVPVLAVGLFASCDTDETGADTSLPDGKYPLQLTAELVQPQTRAAGKDAWTGSDAIAVRMDDTIGKYVVDATGNATPATAADVLYWQSSADAEVAAWYPYTDGGTKVYDISDQSGGYEEFDFLRATATARYNESVNLRFHHRMAKVEAALTAGDGITVAELAGASVTFFGEKSASVTDGTVGAAGKSDVAITPYRNSGTNTFEAVVVPQNMKDKQLIRVSLGGKTFVYTPQTDAAGNLEPGKRYGYHITVKANGIEVTAVTGGTWSEDGEVDMTIFKAYTKAKRGDYLLRDGCLLDKGNLTDALKDDVAAIVFWTPADTDPTGRTTPASMTDDKIMAKDYPNCTHGLAVSVKDLSTEMEWQEFSENIKAFQNGSNFAPSNKSDYKSIASNKEETDNINYILGYQNTQVLRAFNAWCAPNKRVKPVDALDNFSTTCPAPAGSTGWFIPSPKELHMLFYKDVDNIFIQWDDDWTETRYIVNSSLSSTGGDVLSEYNRYWSSTEYEYDNANAFNIDFYSGCVDDGGKGFANMVRAVCAF